MKARIPALLILFVSSQGAHAQNVELYGKIDTGFERITNVGPEGSSITRATRLTGGFSPSRLGIRGSENLRGGLKAIFNLENGFSVTNGSQLQGGRLFGRAAYVGLGGRWGTVTVGRQQEMLWAALMQGDIIGPAAFSLVSFDPFLASARQDNSIAYKVKIEKLTLGATYSFGRDTLAPGNCAGENANDSSSCKAWSAMAQYDGSNWGAAAGYDKQRGGGTSGVTLIPGQAPFALMNSSDKDRRAIIDGFYKFGQLKISGGWIHRRISTNAPLIKNDIYFAGVSYPVTSNILLDVQYAALDSSQAQKDGRLLVARAGYSLSKRTTAYVMAGHVSNDVLASFSVTGSSPISAAPRNGQSQNGVYIGLAHRF